MSVSFDIGRQLMKQALTPQQEGALIGALGGGVGGAGLGYLTRSPGAGAGRVLAGGGLGMLGGGALGYHLAGRGTADAGESSAVGPAVGPTPDPDFIANTEKLIDDTTEKTRTTLEGKTGDKSRPRVEQLTPSEDVRNVEIEPKSKKVPTMKDPFGDTSDEDLATIKAEKSDS